MCQGPLLFRRDFSISLQGVEVALCEGFACGRTWGLKKNRQTVKASDYKNHRVAIRIHLVK